MQKRLNRSRWRLGCGPPMVDPRNHALCVVSDPPMHGKQPFVHSYFLCERVQRVHSSEAEVFVWLDHSVQQRGLGSVGCRQCLHTCTMASPGVELHVGVSRHRWDGVSRFWVVRWRLQALLRWRLQVLSCTMASPGTVEMASPGVELYDGVSSGEDWNQSEIASVSTLKDQPWTSTPAPAAAAANALPAAVGNKIYSQRRYNAFLLSLRPRPSTWRCPRLLLSAGTAYQPAIGRYLQQAPALSSTPATCCAAVDWRDRQTDWHRMNVVNARRARLVPGCVTVFGAGIPSRYVTSQLGQLSLASLRSRLIEYQLRLR